MLGQVTNFQLRHICVPFKEGRVFEDHDGLLKFLCAVNGFRKMELLNEITHRALRA